MILRRYCSVLGLFALATTAAIPSGLAQSATTTAKKPSTTPSAPTHATAAATTTAAAEAPCANLPELSPKIPALPPGSPCARPLYTISTTPQAKFDYVSPMESPELAKFFGIEPISFSLNYVDTQVGTGELAAPHKWYTVHYTGYLADGTKFDSSVDRNEPFTLHVGAHSVIAGWDTGFDGMRVGGKRRLFIPYQLAYGPQGKPPVIPPNSELIFDIELIAQSDTEPAKPTPPAPTAPAPSDKPAPPPPPAGSAKPETSPKPQGL